MFSNLFLNLSSDEISSRFAQGSQRLDTWLEWIDSQKIELYPAQEEAMLALFEGKNVILNTPTGSGKSLVAQALHVDSLLQGRRSIYTSPIKALVNEKFIDLCEKLGPDQVGMMTGDGSINPDARVICCTAEVLSQMALRMGELTPFQDVVMDEFHYYSDKDRGSAWQIPLLIMKQSRFLLMSATLGDVSFFQECLTQLNGLETLWVRSSERPVPLDFEYSERPLHFKLTDLVTANKTPIYLVNFTQRECAEEAQNLLSVDYCTKDEKKKISDFIVDVDFKSPYGKEFQRFIKHGIGIHHAGLLPRYRILVEKLAQRGLLKIICGTDTLGVGVNVPIRTVVFKKLCKFDGDRTTLLSVRDFQQISGRAGRKGYDSQGSVVVQAPEHVIENLDMEAKAVGDPKKQKKLVKRKPPEKGYIPWSQETLLKLSQGQPEVLTSRFQVDHAMVLNILSRPGTENCRSLRDLIRHSHEPESRKKHHRKMASRCFRSLLDRKIIELNPLRLHVDLQEDFSLNHGLSLWLIDTLKLLEAELETHEAYSAEYALDVLTLVESIVENPDLILRRQVDLLKQIEMSRMKEEGIEFDERIERLEQIEYPKPKRDFIYSTFNQFIQNHPWMTEQNIRPKSIAREMMENYYSFHEYIREYDLQRVEGLLLRYLSDIYKTLVQNVPELSRNRSDELLSVIEYFKTMLKEIDSSLIEEWERLKNPDLLPKQLNDSQKSALNLDASQLKSAQQKQIKLQQIQIRNEIYRFINYVSRGRVESAIEILAAHPSASFDRILVTQKLEQWIEDFKNEHGELLLHAEARSLKSTTFKEIEESAKSWQVEQRLYDSQELNDTFLKFEVKWSLPSGPSEPSDVSSGNREFFTLEWL
jgi:superfamily II RNA helicase